MFKSRCPFSLGVNMWVLEERCRNHGWYTRLRLCRQRMKFARSTI